VSKAFTKDDDAGAPPVVPHRAPLPAGQPNYVTARGLVLLRAELAGLRAEQARRGTSTDTPPDTTLLERLAELEERLAATELVTPACPAPSEVRFGAIVTVRTEAGAERTFSIVGVDEANVSEGRIAFVAPVARALLGKRSGDVATVRAPHGEEELEIVRVVYESGE
jgi:transcription elongation factor GreB